MQKFFTMMLFLMFAVSSDAIAAGNNWLTSLDDSLPLSQFSIRGTHVSNNINPRLSTYFTANPSGRFGAILMDSPTARGVPSFTIRTHPPVALCIIQRFIRAAIGKYICVEDSGNAGGAPIMQYSNLTTTDAQMPTGAFYRIAITRSP